MRSCITSADKQDCHNTSADNHMPSIIQAVLLATGFVLWTDRVFCFVLLFINSGSVQD